MGILGELQEPEFELNGITFDHGKRKLVQISGELE